MTDHESQIEIEGVANLTKIGQGGFGTVYRGVESSLQRDVAVKILPVAIDQKARDRFERERVAMGSLSGHPHIATVHRVGLTSDDQPYLVMEYLSGGSLRDRLNAAGRLHWSEVAAIGVKIAGAVETAHRSGVLHRDIKPANIFVSGLNEPKLGDFGIARLQGAAETKSASITASMAHAPPEVISGARPDARSDVYSLASTMYELLAGRPAFVGVDEDTMVPMLARIASVEAPRPVVDPAGEATINAVLGAMAKDPNRRPATARDFAESLRSAQAAGGYAPSPLLVEGPEPQPVDNVNHTKALTPQPPAQQQISQPIQPAPPVAPPAPAPTHGTGYVTPNPQVQAPGNPSATPPPAGGWNSGAQPLMQPQPASGSSKAPMIVAALALACVLAGATVFALLNGDDGDTVATGTTVVTTPGTQPSVAPQPTTPVDEPPATQAPPATGTVAPPSTSVPGADEGGDDGGTAKGFGDIAEGVGDLPDTGEQAPVSGDERDSAGRLVLTRVTDDSGAVSMEVPVAWASRTEDATDNPVYQDLASLGFGISGFSAGASFEELSSSDLEDRDFSKSGVATFILSGAHDPSDPFDVMDMMQDELDSYADTCIVAEPEFVSDAPIGDVAVGTVTSCEGGIFPIVIIVTFVPDQDQTLAGALYFQLGEQYGEDFDSLDEITASLVVNTNLVPT